MVYNELATPTAAIRNIFNVRSPENVFKRTHISQAE